MIGERSELEGRKGKGRRDILKYINLRNS